MEWPLAVFSSIEDYSQGSFLRDYNQGLQTSSPSILNVATNPRRATVGNMPPSDKFCGSTLTPRPIVSCRKRVNRDLHSVELRIMRKQLLVGHIQTALPDARGTPAPLTRSQPTDVCTMTGTDPLLSFWPGDERPRGCQWRTAHC